jgi:glycosyltransferase involved in cell wall biosynthesis
MTSDLSCLVNIIIPVYNGERYLAQAIESALAQTYRPVQVVVVDDGSTDASLQLAQQYSNSISFCTQPHRGISAARNRGVELAQGDFLAFLDADDVWLEDKLARQMAVFLRHPELDMVFGQVSQFVSPELQEAVKRKLRVPTEPMAGYSADSMLIKRTSFLRVGLFDPTWEIGEFLDWYAKAIEKGLRSTMLAEVVTRRRVHDSNQGVRMREFRKDYVRVLKAALDRRRQS